MNAIAPTHRRPTVSPAGAPPPPSSPTSVGLPPPEAQGGAPPGAPPHAPPFKQALKEHWARTATAEGRSKQSSRARLRHARIARAWRASAPLPPPPLRSSRPDRSPSTTAATASEQPRPAWRRPRRHPRPPPGVPLIAELAAPSPGVSRRAASRAGRRPQCHVVRRAEPCSRPSPRLPPGSHLPRPPRLPTLADLDAERRRFVGADGYSQSDAARHKPPAARPCPVRLIWEPHSRPPHPRRPHVVTDSTTIDSSASPETASREPHDIPIRDWGRRRTGDSRLAAFRCCPIDRRRDSFIDISSATTAQSTLRQQSPLPPWGHLRPPARRPRRPHRHPRSRPPHSPRLRRPPLRSLRLRPLAQTASPRPRR